MPKVAIYCRLSEEDRHKLFKTDDSNSIQNQKSMLLQYAMEQGWEIFNIYSDDDYTGADRNRPEFQRLLQDAQQRKFDIILCKTQSRFTRELELVEKYIHGLFPQWGIRFISIVDNADTANKGNKKSRQINGLINEWYLEDMSENIRSVLNNRRQNGFHIGSFAPYGYKKDPDQKGHLLIDGEAAAVVREVFTLFSQGCGKTAIARSLNDRSIPNPTEYKRLHGLCPSGRKNSTLWTYSAISHMLANEVYIGNMVQGKYGSISYKTKQNKPKPKSEWYRVPGTHEAVIDRTLWDRVQAILAQRAKPFQGGCVGLFARKARCANCGYSMRSTKSRGRHYLQCPIRHTAKHACTGAFISVEKLEIIVLDELNRLLDLYLDRNELERNIGCFDTLPARKNRFLCHQAAYKKRVDEYVKGIQSLYLDKAKGILPETDFTRIKQEFLTEKERLERLLASEEKQAEEIDAQIASGNSRQEVLTQYTHLTSLTREMVELLIDYISVGKRIPGTKNVPVEIHWNF